MNLLSSADSGLGNAASPALDTLRPVLRAYEQVAEQLWTLIATGQIKPGERLPTEASLASRFDVSRPTIREALRVLAARNVIRTAPGAGGGSHVTLPTPDHVSELLRSNLSLLSQANEVSLEELLELRRLLEVPAARFAAERRTPAYLEHMHETIPANPLALPVQDQFSINMEFHSAVVEGSGNILVRIAAQPLFDVLEHNLRPSRLSREFHRAINTHHREIAAAITEGDGDAAAGLMDEHLSFLWPYYEQGWRGRRQR